jgi:phosphoglycolate phosphatase
VEVKNNSSPFKLIVTDIDNTLFDWVNYYVTSFNALLMEMNRITGTDIPSLAAEAREVFERHGSIEYPFLIQELKSVVRHYGSNIDQMLAEAVIQGRDSFLKASKNVLRPYPDVVSTLEKIKSKYPELPVVALSDAPRYVAMWKLNKLGILDFFDAVYGLADPRVPTCETTRRVKVDPEILLKHLQQLNFGFKGKIRILPDDYEKPGIRGLKTVLMDFDLDEPASERHRIIWIGDNLRKDIGLGNRLGVVSVWAKYGADVERKLLDGLSMFSPAHNIHKNVYLKSDAPDAPKPDLIFNSFADLLKQFNLK